MAVGSLSPVSIQQFFDNNGNPLSGGSLSFYLAGTSTPSPAYADQDLLVALPNPVVLDAAGRAPELFLDSLSYKQVLKNALGATIWSADNIRSAGLLAQLTFAPNITTMVASGTQNNVATGSGHNRVLVCTNTTADLTITGFQAGVDGDTLLVLANGTANVYLTHDDGASLDGNRLTNSAHSGPTPLVGGYGTAQYQYFGINQHWKLINHDQGHFIAIPYSAANFISEPGGAWNVTEAAVLENRYLLSGSTIEITTTIGPSTMSGGSGMALQILGWPYSFLGPVPGQAAQHTAWTSVDTAGYNSVVAHVFLGQRIVRIVKAVTGAPNFPAGNFYVFGQARFEVQ